MLKHMKKNWKQARWNEIFLILFFICTIIAWGLWRINEHLAPIILMDEFGYWGNAAFLTGRDWSEIAQFNAYYSYGYSLFLALIMLLFSSTALSYQAAILLNCVFLCMTFILLIKIGSFLFPNANRGWTIVSAYIAIIYPTYCANMHIAWDETLLVFMSVLCVYALTRLLKKPGILNACFFCVSLFYSYTVHQRCLGLLAAGILVLILMLINRNIKIKHVAGFAGGLLILFAVHSLLKGNILQNVLISAENENASINDYSSIWQHIIYWFNLEGLGKLLLSFAGKIFYLMVSTYGIFSLGIFFMLRKCLEKKEENSKRFSEEKVVYVFILLTFAATLGIASIFTLDAIRLDSLVYGRYTEWVIAPIILIALLMIDENRNETVVYMLNIIAMLVLGLILISVYKTHPEWDLFFAICSLVMAMYDSLTASNGYQFLYLSSVFAATIMFLIGFFAHQKVKWRRILIALILILLFSLNTYWCTNRVYRSNYRVNILKSMDERINENTDEDIYFVMDEGQTIWYAADLQVMNMDRKIYEVPLEDLNTIRGYVIIATESDYVQNGYHYAEVQAQDSVVTLLYLENE